MRLSFVIELKRIRLKLFSITNPIDSFSLASQRPMNDINRWSKTERQVCNVSRIGICLDWCRWLLCLLSSRWFVDGVFNLFFSSLFFNSSERAFHITIIGRCREIFCSFRLFWEISYITRSEFREYLYRPYHWKPLLRSFNWNIRTCRDWCEAWCR